MAIKEWTTHYPTSQDVVATDQPTLVDGVDDTRVSQIHTMRNKLDSVAQLVGDDSMLPAGCLREIQNALVARVHYFPVWGFWPPNHFPTPVPGDGYLRTDWNSLDILYVSAFTMPSQQKPYMVHMCASGFCDNPAATGYLYVSVQNNTGLVFDWECWFYGDAPVWGESQITWNPPSPTYGPFYVWCFSSVDVPLASFYVQTMGIHALLTPIG
jgi:hypothetical protein